MKKTLITILVVGCVAFLLGLQIYIVTKNHHCQSQAAEIQHVAKPKHVGSVSTKLKSIIYSGNSRYLIEKEFKSFTKQEKLKLAQVLVEKYYMQDSKLLSKKKEKIINALEEKKEEVVDKDVEYEEAVGVVGVESELINDVMGDDTVDQHSRDSHQHINPEDIESHKESEKKMEETKKLIEQTYKDHEEEHKKLTEEVLKLSGDEQKEKEQEIHDLNLKISEKRVENRKHVVSHHMKTYKHKKDILLHPALTSLPPTPIQNYFTKEKPLLIFGASSYLGMMITSYLAQYGVPIAILINLGENDHDLDRIMYNTIRERVYQLNKETPIIFGCDKLKEQTFGAILDASKKFNLCEGLELDHPFIIDASGGKVKENNEKVNVRISYKVPEVVGPYDITSKFYKITNDLMKHNKAPEIEMYHDGPLRIRAIGARDWIRSILWGMEKIIEDDHHFPNGKTSIINLKAEAPIVNMEEYANAIASQLKLKDIQLKKKKMEGNQPVIPKETYTGFAKFRLRQMKPTVIVSDMVYWYTEYFFPTTIVMTTYLTQGLDPQRNIQVAHSRPEKMLDYYLSIHSLEHPLVVTVLYDQHSGDFIKEHESAVFRFKKVQSGLHRKSFNDDRFWLFQDYLNELKYEENHLEPYRPHYVMFTDLFDVKFNRNPVEFMAAEPNLLYIGRDVDEVLGQNGYIRFVSGRCKLHTRLPKYYQYQLLNPGVVGASFDTALLLMDRMVNGFDDLDINTNCNLVVFNYVVQELYSEKKLDYFHGEPFSSPFTKNDCSEKYYVCHK